MTWEIPWNSKSRAVREARPGKADRSIEDCSPIRSFERSRDSISVEDLAYWWPTARVAAFRWSVLQNEHTRAIAMLEGTSKYLMTGEAQLAPVLQRAAPIGSLRMSLLAAMIRAPVQARPAHRQEHTHEQRDRTDQRR